MQTGTRISCSFRGDARLGSTVRADGVDPLHCGAIGVRKQEQLYQCFGRCERRSGWRIVRTGADDEARLRECRSDCQDRYDEAIDLLVQHDVCGTSYPARCQTRLERIDAARAACTSQCGTAADAIDCVKTCDTRCTEAVERLLSKDFCVGYAAGNACLEHPAND